MIEKGGTVVHERPAHPQTIKTKYVTSVGAPRRHSLFGAVTHYCLTAPHRNRRLSRVPGFEIAGGDGVYQWADAKIESDTVIVPSPKVAKSVNVHYGWSRNHTWANLFNKDRLAALTFRTAKRAKVGA